MFFYHLWGVFWYPDREWVKVKQEKTNWFTLLFIRLVWLCTLPPLTTWYGTTKTGWILGHQGVVRLTEDSALWMAILGWFAILFGLLVMGAFIQWMSREYGAEVSYKNSVNFCSYVAFPLIFASILGVYPDIGLVMIAALIGVAGSVRLLYTGLPYFMDIPKERAFTYASSVVCVGLVMFISILMISIVFWSVGVGPEYL